MTRKGERYHWTLIILAARTAEVSVIQTAQPVTVMIDNRML